MDLLGSDFPFARNALRGKHALIFGAGKGIGAATAKMMAFAGADVTLCARNLANLQAVADDIGAQASGRIAITDRMGGRFIPETIPAGATVTTYGKVPRGIEMVANYLVGNALQEIASRQNANANPIDPARIKREETDDYQYELFSASEARSLITGSAKFDTILQAFTRPGGVRII